MCAIVAIEHKGISKFHKAMGIILVKQIKQLGKQQIYQDLWNGF